MSDRETNYRRLFDKTTIGYRKWATTTILAIALVGFETFNFSTTAYALGDLLGELSFLGLRWSTTLAIAFCAIDFAGVARLFLPESENQAPKELWFLFGAWLLAATMNAVLTWWGISMAVVNRALASTAIINPQILTHSIPVFIAILVWITRILLIGSFSITVKPVEAAGLNQRTLGNVHSRNIQPAQQPLIVRRKERSSFPRVEPAPQHRQQINTIRNLQEESEDERPEPVYVPMDAAFHSLSASRNERQNHAKHF